MSVKGRKKLRPFNLNRGFQLGADYTVIEKIGAGSEGEVYKVRERYTSKEKACKLFYPHKNPNFITSIRYAKKLDKLRDSPIVMDYYSHDVFNIQGLRIASLSSELIEGEVLGEFVKKQRLGRLGIFPAIHLLYTVALGLESIHLNGEYHGDLHTDNVIIRRFGLEFDIKIFDFHHWGDSKKDNRDEDIIKMIRIFYDILGGAKIYPKLPESIKYIICGLKRGLILKRFKTISEFRVYLETMDWSDAI